MNRLKQIFVVAFQKIKDCPQTKILVKDTNIQTLDNGKLLTCLCFDLTKEREIIVLSEVCFVFRCQLVRGSSTFQVIKSHLREFVFVEQEIRISYHTIVIFDARLMNHI